MQTFRAQLISAVSRWQDYLVSFKKKGLSPILENLLAETDAQIILQTQRFVTNIHSLSQLWNLLNNNNNAPFGGQLSGEAKCQL